MSGGPLDAPAAVRPGEELDLVALGRYLRRRLPEAGVEVAADAELAVRQFPSGWSNLTYLLRLGGRELVLRRPPFGNVVRSAHDMAREHRVLSALAPVWALAPRPYLLCEDEAVIGAPFYVMERVEGVVLRRRPPRSRGCGGRRGRRSATPTARAPAPATWAQVESARGLIIGGRGAVGDEESEEQDSNSSATSRRYDLVMARPPQGRR